MGLAVNLKSLQWVERLICQNFDRDRWLMTSDKALGYHLSKMRSVLTDTHNFNTWANISTELLAIATISNVVIGRDIHSEKWDQIQTITRHKENTLIAELHNVLDELEEAFKRRNQPETYDSMISDISTRIWVICIAGTKLHKHSIIQWLTDSNPKNINKIAVVSEYDDYHLHCYKVIDYFGGLMRTDIHHEFKFRELVNGHDKTFGNMWAWYSTVLPRRLAQAEIAKRALDYRFGY